jgi:hypothetical protein
MWEALGSVRKGENESRERCSIDLVEDRHALRDQRSTDSTSDRASRCRRRRRIQPPMLLLLLLCDVIFVQRRRCRWHSTVGIRLSTYSRDCQCCLLSRTENAKHIPEVLVVSMTKSLRMTPPVTSTLETYRKSD